jgi:hypothetical protein
MPHIDLPFDFLLDFNLARERVLLNVSRRDHLNHNLVTAQALGIEVPLRFSQPPTRPLNETATVRKEVHADRSLF